MNVKLRLLSLSIVLTLVVSFFIIAPLVQIKIINGHKYYDYGKKRRTHTTIIIPVRGEIVDSSPNQVVFASSVYRYRLSVDPNKIALFNKDVDHYNANSRCETADNKVISQKGALGFAQLLSSYLQKDQRDEKYSPEKLAYVMTKSGTDGVEVATNVSFETKENLLKNKCVGNNQYISTSEYVVRSYPNKSVAGDEIGYAKSDSDDDSMKGINGLEEAYDELLSGVPGGIESEKIARNWNASIPYSKVNEIKAVNGKDIRTTINYEIQKRVQKILDDGMVNAGAKEGYAVIENVKNGHILAMTSTARNDAGPKAVNGSLAVTSTFEPGSTSKIMTATELVEDGLATIESPYVTGWLYHPPYDEATGNNKSENTISDSHYHPIACYTLTGIMGQSYNTGTVIASKDLTLEKRYKMLKKFGFGNLTGINLLSEVPGYVRGDVPASKDDKRKPWERTLSGTNNDGNEWDARSADNVLFGQGYSATALQMTNAYAIVSNGGKNPVPTLIEATRDSGSDKWVPYNKPEGKQIYKKSTSDKINQLLEASVVDGISAGAKIKGYRIGGKSGTSEITDNSNNKNVMSFISVFPMDDPTYAVGVFYRDAEILRWGATAAVPPDKEINQLLIQEFSIPPSKPVSYLPKSTC